jgi:hypothetical protein
MARKNTGKKAKTSSSASKKTSKKLEDLNQTHGKEEYRPTTLDQIWGDQGTARYGTMSLEEYRLQLRDMQRVDIHAHASKVGIIPIDNRELLTNRLVKEFEKHVGTYRAPMEKREFKTADKLSSSARKTLAEGR